MKNLLFLITATFLNLYAQATLYTPNGKSFQTYNADWQGTYNQATYEYEKNTLFGEGNLYSNSHVVGDWENNIWEYNCHSFAWNNWQGANRWNSESDVWKLGKPSPLELYWMDYPTVFYSDNDNPLGIVSYISCNQNEASIITCYNAGITHSARIVGDGTRYISKWGKTHIVNHPPTEVPYAYGNTYLSYKINPAYRPIGAGDPAGRNWQTLNNAMNGIPSSGKVFVLSGTATSSGTVNIPSGVELKVNSSATLTVQSGSTLNFSNTAKFDVYGTLNATNSTFDFTAQNSSLQNGIRCYYPASTNISGCTIRNAWYGIALDNYVGSHVTNTNITNCRYGYYAYNSTPASDYGLNISNCYYGVYLYNCPAPATMIGGNNIHNNTIGISLYNSDVYLLDNEISYNSYHGVYCSSGSDAKIEENNIHHNSYQGVYCYNNSYPNLGYEGPYEYIYGWNSIEQNSSHNVHSEVSGVIWALQNWWGSNPPPTNKFYAQNGTIAYTPYLTSPPSIQQNIAADDGNSILAETSVSSSYSKPTRMLLDAMNLITEKKYVEARELCLNIINTYPDSSASYNALSLISETFENNEKESLQNIYRGYFDKKTNKRLYAAAGLMYARLADENRIQKIDEVISSYSGDPIVELALHDKFIYYFNEERDLDKAIVVSNELDKLFPGSEGSLDAQRMLGNIKLAKSSQNSSDKLNLANENKPIDFQLFPNHPNPFNPVTTINYTLPIDEFVVLKVYDILGREVTTLVNEEKQAGTYSVSFDASNLTSGIYFYSISAGKFNQVNKMILLR